MEPIPSLLSLAGVQPIVMPDTQQSLWNRGDCKGNFQPPASRNGAAVAEVTCELQSSFTSAVVHQESPRVTVRRGTKKELKLFCGENNSQINPKHWNLSEKKKSFARNWESGIVVKIYLQKSREISWRVISRISLAVNLLWYPQIIKSNQSITELYMYH